MSDLILQAIVLPTDTPAEIRAAVADALAHREESPAHTWEDVVFAASAVALIEGTNQRDVPDTQWVFALGAREPKLGQQVHSGGSWSVEISGTTSWRAVLFDAVTTEPRTQPESVSA
jgi:hypothetical protein